MTIAKIKLAPGNAGWYDVLSGIHVTIGNPIGEVKAGMNITNIKKGLMYKTILLISGSLEEDKIIAQVEQINNEVIQPSVVQETKAQVAEACNKEAQATETQQEVVEVEKPKKATKSKSKSK